MRNLRSTKFVTGVVFRQVQKCAKFHCPSQQEHCFPERGGIHPGHRKPKKARLK